MEEIIVKNKPNLSKSTVKTYISLLKSLYYKKHDKGTDIDIDWFNNQDEIIELLKDKIPSNRKTTFSALMSVATKKDKYTEQLGEDIKTYKTENKKQKMSDKQKDNWIDFEEIEKINKDMYKKVKPLLLSEELTPEEFKKLQTFIILSLTSGYWFPPRRSQDWTNFKIKNIDKQKDNYIDKNNFVFNSYKTAKTYGKQTVEIPKVFKTILTKYIKLNPHDYLIATESGSHLSNARLTQILNQFFGKNISTSMLRHIYLTNKLKDVPTITEMEKTATEMGHSLDEALLYVKHK